MRRLRALPSHVPGSGRGSRRPRYPSCANRERRALSKSAARADETRRLCSKSSSVSPGKPTITSVVRLRFSVTRRPRAARAAIAAYCSAVYGRRMARKVLLQQPPLQAQVELRAQLFDRCQAGEMSDSPQHIRVKAAQPDARSIPSTTGGVFHEFCQPGAGIAAITWQADGGQHNLTGSRLRPDAATRPGCSLRCGCAPGRGRGELHSKRRRRLQPSSTLTKARVCSAKRSIGSSSNCSPF